MIGVWVAVFAVLWVLGVVSMALFWGAILKHWMAISYEMQCLGPKARRALAWPEIRASGIHWYHTMWQRQRMQTRVLLFGFPEFSLASEEVLEHARKFRRLTLVACAPFVGVVALIAAIDPAFLIWVFAFCALIVVSAGPWPRISEIEECLSQ